MAGAGGVRVSNRRLFCAQELVHRRRLCFLWLHGELVWAVDIYCLPGQNHSSLGLWFFCPFWRQSGHVPLLDAGSGGRLWLLEASCPATSSRDFSSQLPIS
ncbi:hypothetical protein F2Q69_00051039 [Brassica cretica]|uniref:Uncharacterized protein n=1 Tax=Brassica cretica TaxID=69181 RepID=A0A8S9PST4_BRACR|nr:hypothetical protein F2Q69_00051039 [Brassica cretica]